MATLRNALLVIAQNDATLAALLPGGIWDRPLRWPATADQASDPEFTPGAFDAGGRIKPAAVLTVAGIGAAPGGGGRLNPLAGAVDLLAERSITWWIYQPAPGRDIIEAAKWRLRDLFQYRQVATDNEGMGVVLEFMGDLGDGLDDPELDASVEHARFAAGLVLAPVA